MVKRYEMLGLGLELTMVLLSCNFSQAVFVRVVVSKPDVV